MEAAEAPICVSVLHGLAETFGQRFHLVDGRERGYVVWTERELGFRVCSGERVLVQVTPGSRIGWSASDLPRRLEVFLDGEHRGFIRRPPLGSFRRDVLTLDRREYPLPRRLERDAGDLGMELSWGMLNGRPSICVRPEEDLRVGLLVLAYTYVRALAVGS